MSNSVPLMVPRSVRRQKQDDRFYKGRTALTTSAQKGAKIHPKKEPHSVSSTNMVAAGTSSQQITTKSKLTVEKRDTGLSATIEIAKCSTENAQETGHSELTQKVVQEVLSDIVNKSCSEDDLGSKVVELKSNMVTVPPPCSVAAAIQKQSDVMYKDTGPVCYSKKVPVYQRRRKPACGRENQGPNHYTGLAWKPASSRSRHEYSYTFSGSDEYYPRQWEYTNTGKYYMRRPEQHRGFEFTVMSYNVLAQNLLEDNFGLYTNCLPEALEWENRRRLLMKELKYHSPDIICLQEVNCDHYEEFFLPELQQRGYEGSFMKRTGDKLDGCATFYKKRKFSCDEVIQVPYYKAEGGSLLDRDNVALILKLKPLSRSLPSSRYIFVSNTHLLFNPRRGDIKLAQLVILLAELDKCAHLEVYPDQYYPVIMCGDFNCEPHCELYKLILMGHLNYEGLLSRLISGQEDGRYGKSFLTLDKDFIPTELGISDQCQYCQTVKKRAQEKNWKKRHEFDDDDVIVVDEKGKKIPPKRDTGCDVEVTYTQGSGSLMHQLRLVSVYEHWLSRLNYRHREVTTHHGRASCTVDYIFYGVRSGLVRFHHGEVQTKDIQEGHLNLLARYGLLSARELQQLGSLPNESYGSDHLSLMARFLLT